MPENKRMPIAMAIGGSDSGAGAGIQADLKTFSALGVYGTCAVTAVTAQNTVGVEKIEEISPEMVAAQIKVLLYDIKPSVIKTGMLSSKSVIGAVVTTLLENDSGPGISQPNERIKLVVDPVMVAKSGDRLLRDDAVWSLCQELFPLADIVTPNIPEAEVLTGKSITSESEMEEAARQLVSDMGVKSALVKGGHLDGPATDILYDGRLVSKFSTPRIPTVNTHGTGCTFASAIAGYMAKGMDITDSVAAAKKFVTSAIEHSFAIGHGHGPLNHYFAHFPSLDAGE